MLHNITILFTYYLHILHRLQIMKMTFLKLFLICTFKYQNLAENEPIWRKIIKKGELRGVHGVCFFQVRPYIHCLYINTLGLPVIAKLGLVVTDSSRFCIRQDYL